MGYRVAGKTGTAHKQEGGGYAERKYRASFVGFAPVSAPRLVVAVMIDEPAGRNISAATSRRRCSAAWSAVRCASPGVTPDAPMRPDRPAGRRRGGRKHVSPECRLAPSVTDADTHGRA